MEDLPLQPPAPSKRTSPVLILVLVLALGAAAFAVWKFLDGKSDGETTTPARTDQPAPVKPYENGSTPTAPVTSPVQPEQPAVKSALSRARQHLAGDADPAAGISLAKELRAVEGGADAAFLLAEDAAQKGNVEAMLITGGFYDPTDASPSGSIMKDPVQALQWYRQARDAGFQAAGPRLDALRQWAEQQSAAGSAEARELLRQF